MPSDELSGFVLRVPTELGVDVPEQFEASVSALLARHPEAIALDCSAIDHLTSMHVKLLWTARTLCVDAGVAVRLAQASKYVWKVLQVLDLAEFFIADDPSTQRRDAANPTEIMGSMDVYEDTFEADVPSIDSALERFVANLTTLSVPSSTIYVLRTLFYEVATNIRLHSKLSGESPGTVQFSAIPEQAKIVLTFVDDGACFDPTEFEIAGQATADNAEGRRSFGITIMKKLADRLVYRRVDDTRNVLVIERNWRSPQWSHTRSPSAP